MMVVYVCEVVMMLAGFMIISKRGELFSVCVMDVSIDLVSQHDEHDDVLII